MSAYLEILEAGAFLELVWTSISAYTSCMGVERGKRGRDREEGREGREAQGGISLDITC